MLAALGIRYGSDEAIDFSTEVHKTLAIEAYRSSVKMAKERGAFPIYNQLKEEKNPFIGRIKEADAELYNEMIKNGRRNIALLTIAPTGSVSLETQTTSGIENLFLPTYVRKKKVNPNDKNAHADFVDKSGDAWEYYNVLHDKFTAWLRINGHDVEKIKKIAEESGRNNEMADELEAIVKKSPYYKSTAMDVDWVNKVKMQGAIQKWVDHSISVTVNLPEDISEEMVGKVYQTAWESGCKGITVFRANSREGVLTSNKNDKSLLEKASVENPIKVPDIMPAIKVKQQTPRGNLHLEGVVSPVDKYSMIEVFAELGNAGDEEPAIMEALGRMGSLYLRSGGNVQEVISQLKDIGSGAGIVTRDGGVNSLPQGFARALMKIGALKDIVDMDDFMTGKVDYNEVSQKVSDLLRTGKNGNETESPEEIKNFKETDNKKMRFKNKCPNPECGASLAFVEGCEKCLSCGYSKC
jgi:ribonucleoside-diphosphate reductase alpha chain